jgi:hypothetical protein
MCVEEVIGHEAQSGEDLGGEICLRFGHWTSSDLGQSGNLRDATYFGTAAD